MSWWKKAKPNEQREIEKPTTSSLSLQARLEKEIARQDIAEQKRTDPIRIAAAKEQKKIKAEFALQKRFAEEIKKLLGVEIAPSPYPKQIDGLWFTLRHIKSGDTWDTYTEYEKFSFCWPCSKCGVPVPYGEIGGGLGLYGESYALWQSRCKAENIGNHYSTGTTRSAILYKEMLHEQTRRSIARIIREIRDKNEAIVCETCEKPVKS